MNAITYKQEAVITYAKFIGKYAFMFDLFGIKDQTATKDMDMDTKDSKDIYKDRGLMWWVC